MHDAQELGTFLRQATRTLFRLETQPTYADPDFPRYLAGEPGPDMERKGKWLDFLREQREQGIYRHRVRVLHTPLSDYDRYACEWGYAHNVPAGDDTRILNRAAVRLPEGFFSHDYWLIDDMQVARMLYDGIGQFIGAEVLYATELGRYQTIRDAMWAVAEPFETWWPRQQVS